ncbi:MAG TPA: family 43 glycosylhydrolase [Polyangia bacterium]|nr:family 43 glycosylhydrolase [Polyangia bacterium]
MRAFKAGWLFASILTASSSVQAATSGDNGVHDPSRMIACGGKLYVYATGGGGKSSSNGLAWTNVPTPTWNESAVPDNQGLWAPDGFFANGRYYLYGAMWSAAKASAIVLMTSPTLDASASNYKWTYQGVAINAPAGVTHSAIDPGPVFDADGNLWLVWGGGYPFSSTADSIFVTRLDNQTGLPIATDPGYKPPNQPGYPIAQGHREGPYIYYHEGYYYLFWQTGSCCDGASSTYKINVSRATAITGPYSGDRVFYGGGNGVNGPGQIGIYDACGYSRFTYHYYPNSGGSVLGENELEWSGGWPAVGAASTTPITVCSTTDSGTGGSSVGTGGTGGQGGMGGGSGGTGGALGGTGGAGSGGSGSSDDAGAVAGTGGSGSGGSPGTGGGSEATGGTTSTGGAPGLAGTGGAAGNTTVATTESAGCSCETAGGSGHGGDLEPLLLAVAGSLLRARRPRRRQEGLP